MLTAEVLLEGCEFPHLRATTTLLRGGGTAVVVDPGSRYDAALLVRALDQRGLRPEDVDLVVNTHMHYDHFENTELFPRARVLIGRTEFGEYLQCVQALRAAAAAAPGRPGEAAWRRQVLDAVEEAVRARYQAINAFYLSRISQGLLRDLAFWTACEEALQGRLLLTDGPHALADNATVVPAPGHTAGHVAVVVTEADGAQLVVAGDAFPTEKWLAGRAALPLCADVAAFLRTRDALARAADRVIPGHGGMFRTAGRDATGSDAA